MFKWEIAEAVNIGQMPVHSCILCRTFWHGGLQWFWEWLCFTTGALFVFLAHLRQHCFSWYRMEGGAFEILAMDGNNISTSYSHDVWVVMRSDNFLLNILDTDSRKRWKSWFQHLSFLLVWNFPRTRERSWARPEDLGFVGRGVLLRPWQISIHKDAGFKGIADPEILRLLCCSIISQGYRPQRGLHVNAGIAATASIFHRLKWLTFGLICSQCSWGF